MAEGISGMLASSRPASFLTDKIETKELGSLLEGGISRGIQQKRPQRLNNVNGTRLYLWAARLIWGRISL